MRFSKVKIAAPLVACAVAMSMLTLGGCASQEKASEPEPAQEEVVLVVGNPDDVEHMIEVTNATGKEIVEFGCRLVGENEFSALAFAEGKGWANGDAANVFVPELGQQAAASSSSSTSSSAQAAAQSSEPAAEADVLIRDQVDFSFKTADGLMYELHGFALEELDAIGSMTLRINENPSIAYVEYIAVDGKSQSTLESEKAYYDQIAVADTPEAVEEVTESVTETIAPSASAGSGTSSSYTAPEDDADYSFAIADEPATSAPAPEQSEDQCVDGGVQFRD